MASKLAGWAVNRIIESLPWDSMLRTVSDECDRFIMKFSEDTDMRGKVAIARLLRDEIDDILNDAPF